MVFRYLVPPLPKSITNPHDQRNHIFYCHHSKVNRSIRSIHNPSPTCLQNFCLSLAQLLQEYNANLSPIHSKDSSSINKMSIKWNNLTTMSSPEAQSFSDEYSSPHHDNADNDDDNDNDNALSTVLDCFFLDDNPIIIPDLEPSTTTDDLPSNSNSSCGSRRNSLPRKFHQVIIDRVAKANLHLRRQRGSNFDRTRPRIATPVQNLRETLLTALMPSPSSNHLSSSSGIITSYNSDDNDVTLVSSPPSSNRDSLIDCYYDGLGI